MTEVNKIEEPKKQKKTADIKEYRKNYYIQNREKIIEKRNKMKDIYYAPMVCGLCQGKFKKHLRSVHENTKKHTIAKLQMQLNEANKKLKA